MLSMFAFAVALAAPSADPLAPAWTGQVQCYSPDMRSRHCSSIGAYRHGPDGKVLNEAVVAISKAPHIVMTTVAEVRIKDGSTCGLMVAADVANSTFSIEGAPATAEQAALLKQHMTAAMQPLFGREVCVALVASEDGMKGEARVDGTRFPQMDQAVIWVPADAGYSVKMP
jgi:hypothetical protein